MCQSALTRIYCAHNSRDSDERIYLFLCLFNQVEVKDFGPIWEQGWLEYGQVSDQDSVVRASRGIFSLRLVIWKVGFTRKPQVIPDADGMMLRLTVGAKCCLILCPPVPVVRLEHSVSQSSYHCTSQILGTFWGDMQSSQWKNSHELYVCSCFGEGRKVLSCLGFEWQAFTLE